MGSAERVARKKFEELLDENGITRDFLNALEEGGLEEGLKVIVRRSNDIQRIIEQVRKVYVEGGGEMGKPVKVKGRTLGEFLKNLGSTE